MPNENDKKRKSKEETSDESSDATKRKNSEESSDESKRQRLGRMVLQNPRASIWIQEEDRCDLTSLADKISDVLSTPTPAQSESSAIITKTNKSPVKLTKKRSSKTGSQESMTGSQDDINYEPTKVKKRKMSHEEIQENEAAIRVQPSVSANQLPDFSKTPGKLVITQLAQSSVFPSKQSASPIHEVREVREDIVGDYENSIKKVKDENGGNVFEALINFDVEDVLAKLKHELEENNDNNNNNSSKQLLAKTIMDLLANESLDPVTDGIATIENSLKTVAQMCSARLFGENGRLRYIKLWDMFKLKVNPSLNIELPDTIRILEDGMTIYTINFIRQVTQKAQVQWRVMPKGQANHPGLLFAPDEFQIYADKKTTRKLSKDKETQPTSKDTNVVPENSGEKKFEIPVWNVQKPKKFKGPVVEAGEMWNFNFAPNLIFSKETGLPIEITKEIQAAAKAGNLDKDLATSSSPGTLLMVNNKTGQFHKYVGDNIGLDTKVLVDFMAEKYYVRHIPNHIPNKEKEVFFKYQKTGDDPKPDDYVKTGDVGVVLELILRGLPFDLIKCKPAYVTAIEMAVIAQRKKENSNNNNNNQQISAIEKTHPDYPLNLLPREITIESPQGSIKIDLYEQVAINKRNYIFFIREEMNAAAENKDNQKSYVLFPNAPKAWSLFPDMYKQLVPVDTLSGEAQKVNKEYIETREKMEAAIKNGEAHYLTFSEAEQKLVPPNALKSDTKKKNENLLTEEMSKKIMEEGKTYDDFSKKEKVLALPFDQFPEAVQKQSRENADKFKNNAVPSIAILSDFDGTLTGLEGRDLVFSEFYQRLQKCYKPNNTEYNYQNELHPKETLIQKFKETFDNDPNDPRRIQPNAKEFLKTMLSQNNIEIIIISKNQEAYIKAMLEYEGFTPEEIAKITIDTTGDKENAAQGFVSKKTFNYTFIFDDLREDATFMQNGAQKFCKNIIIINEMTGKFDWKNYTNNIQSLCVTPKRRSKEEFGSGNIYGSTLPLFAVQSSTQAILPTNVDNNNIPQYPHKN